MSREAMQLALEALEYEAEGWESVPPITREAIAVLRQAIEQAEQKQVADEVVSEQECRRLLYGFMLDCNAVGIEQAGKNLAKGMKQAAHGIGEKA